MQTDFRNNLTDQEFQTRLEVALNLLRSVPGYIDDASSILFHKILYISHLKDRAQISVLGTIRVGPLAAFASPVSLAGTLVHELHHARQPLLYRTWSFWRGVFRREHPHKWLEWPAYDAQIRFLRAASAAGISGAAEEAEEVLAAFRLHYGEPPIVKQA
jgi:hypothetical protein